VKDVAFPYNELMATSKFVALVKFYFTLGHRVGLYTTDPGFTLSKSWRQDLQDACNDIIDAETRIANEKENGRKRRERLEQSRKQAVSDTEPPPPPSLHSSQQPTLPPPQFKRPRTPRDSVADTQQGNMANEDNDESEQRAHRLRPRGISYGLSQPPYQGTPPISGPRRQRSNPYSSANMPPPSNFHPPESQSPSQRLGADPYESPDRMLRRISEYSSSRSGPRRPAASRRSSARSTASKRGDGAANEKSESCSGVPSGASGTDRWSQPSMSRSQIDHAAM
jgi:hypothetical protein